MHAIAREWNLEHYPDMNGETPKSLIPFNRPCDWCGKPVDIGYIHNGDCIEKERDFYMDIFY